MLHAEGCRPTTRCARTCTSGPSSTWTPRSASVRFLGDPALRGYAICYPAGLARCRDFVAGDLARFRRLLTEQVRVSELVAPGL